MVPFVIPKGCMVAAFRRVTRNLGYVFGWNQALGNVKMSSGSVSDPRNMGRWMPL